MVDILNYQPEAGVSIYWSDHIGLSVYIHRVSTIQRGWCLIIVAGSYRLDALHKRATTYVHSSIRPGLT